MTLGMASGVRVGRLEEEVVVLMLVWEVLDMRGSRGLKVKLKVGVVAGFFLRG